MDQSKHLKYNTCGDTEDERLKYTYTHALTNPNKALNSSSLQTVITSPSSSSSRPRPQWGLILKWRQENVINYKR